MELYFIRHGQSTNNANWGMGDFQNYSDPKLTDTGHLQADLLAGFLKENQKRDETAEWNNQNESGFGFTHLYSSLMVRAVSTAVPISRAINIPLYAWSEIHETGGIYSRAEADEKKGLPGKPRSYFTEKYPILKLPDWKDENGWWNRPYEEKEARKPRAEKVWSEILTRHGDKPGKQEHRIAIISHGGFFNYILTSALGVAFPRLDETRNRFWFVMNNCAISRVDYDDGHVRVCYINRHEYLPDELIT